MKTLFGSNSRYQLLNIIVNRKDNLIGHIRGLERETKIPIHAVRRELKNLEKLGVVKSQTETIRGREYKKYYKTGDTITIQDENIKITIESVDKLK